MSEVDLKKQQERSIACDVETMRGKLEGRRNAYRKKFPGEHDKIEALNRAIDALEDAGDVLWGDS